MCRTSAPDVYRTAPPIGPSPPWVGGRCSAVDVDVRLASSDPPMQHQSLPARSTDRHLCRSPDALYAELWGASRSADVAWEFPALIVRPSRLPERRRIARHNRWRGAGRAAVENNRTRVQAIEDAELFFGLTLGRCDIHPRSASAMRCACRMGGGCGAVRSQQQRRKYRRPRVRAYRIVPTVAKISDSPDACLVPLVSATADTPANVASARSPHTPTGAAVSKRSSVRRASRCWDILHIATTRGCTPSPQGWQRTSDAGHHRRDCHVAEHPGISRPGWQACRTGTRHDRRHSRASMTRALS